MTDVQPIAYAILNSEGRCINRTLWDGNSGWQPPAGCTAIPDPDGLYPVYQEHVPEPDPNPDWSTFKRTALTDPAANAALVAAMPLAPAAALAIPAALLAAADGRDISDFRAAWLLLRHQNLIPQDVMNAMTTLAKNCNLPAEFISCLGGVET
jgi:hypothetical protein